MMYVVRAYNWQGKLDFEHRYEKQSEAMNMACIDINSGSCKEVTITKEYENDGE